MTVSIIPPSSLPPAGALFQSPIRGGWWAFKKIAISLTHLFANKNLQVQIIFETGPRKYFNFCSIHVHISIRFNLIFISCFYFTNKIQIIPRQSAYMIKGNTFRSHYLFIIYSTIFGVFFNKVKNLKKYAHNFNKMSTIK